MGLHLKERSGEANKRLEDGFGYGRMCEGHSKVFGGRTEQDSPRWDASNQMRSKEKHT